MLKLNRKNLILLSLLGLLLLSSYQNCGGKVAFSTQDLSSASGGVDPVSGSHQVQQVLALGVLAKNMDCVMCHTSIRGDVSGFGTLSFRADSMGQFYGNIYG